VSPVARASKEPARQLPTCAQTLMKEAVTLVVKLVTLALKLAAMPGDFESL
jgi:hypothetical protein